MKSRLETMNTSLALEICSASFPDAQQKVEAILVEASERLSNQATKLVSKIQQISTLNVSQDQINMLDTQYFDLEEKGDANGSDAAFIAARYLSAVRAYQTASSHFELCEAAYEAMFASDQTM